MSAANSAPEVVKEEKAIVITLVLSQLGTGVCLDGEAVLGKAMKQPWKNSWSGQETGHVKGTMNRSC